MSFIEFLNAMKECGPWGNYGGAIRNKNGDCPLIGVASANNYRSPGFSEAYKCGVYLGLKTDDITNIFHAADKFCPTDEIREVRKKLEEVCV